MESCGLAGDGLNHPQECLQDSPGNLLPLRFFNVKTQMRSRIRQHTMQIRRRSCLQVDATLGFTLAAYVSTQSNITSKAPMATLQLASCTSLSIFHKSRNLCKITSKTIAAILQQVRRILHRFPNLCKMAPETCRAILQLTYCTGLAILHMQGSQQDN